MPSFNFGLGENHGDLQWHVIDFALVAFEKVTSVDGKEMHWKCWVVAACRDQQNKMNLYVTVH